MEHEYKCINDSPLDKLSVLLSQSSNIMPQDENKIDPKEFSDFDNIDNLYFQIEICWETLDYESLRGELLPKFQSFISKDDFYFSDTFFKNKIDAILFNLISNIGEEDQDGIFFYDIELKKLSMSIIQDLLIRFCSLFPKDSIINFINHIIPIITKPEDEMILLKSINCLLILCNEYHWILGDHVDQIFLLNILDQYNKDDKEFSQSSNSLFYDGDNKICYLIKQILLKITPNFEILSLIINNGDCGMKRFSIFLWLLIKNDSLISLFDPLLYLPRILEIIEKSHNYSIVFPSIILLSNIWDQITEKSTVLLLFPFIQMIQISNISSVSENPPQMKKEENSKFLINICAISLHCISCFISNGPDEAIFCNDNGILDLINENIHPNESQNLIKREAAKLLCNLILCTPQIVAMYPYIRQFYNNENIIDLLLNILEYDEIDMDELILKTLILLYNNEASDLSFLLMKCSENYFIFSEHLNNENQEIALLARRFLDLYEEKKVKVE